MSVTYAKVYGPPDNWVDLDVFDESGAKLDAVIEVNTAEGWLIQYKRGSDGQFITNGDEIETEKVLGKFSIRERVA